MRATIEELKTKGLEVSYSDEVWRKVVWSNKKQAQKLSLHLKKPAAEEPLEAKPDENSRQENLSAEDKQLLDNLTAANLSVDETK